MDGGEIPQGVEAEENIRPDPAGAKKLMWGWKMLLIEMVAVLCGVMVIPAGLFVYMHWRLKQD